MGQWVNSRIGIVKQMCHWGGEEEVIPANIANAVKLLKPLTALPSKTGFMEVFLRY